MGMNILWIDNVPVIDSSYLKFELKLISTLYIWVTGKILGKKHAEIQIRFGPSRQVLYFDFRP